MPQNTYNATYNYGAGHQVKNIDYGNDQMEYYDYDENGNLAFKTSDTEAKSMFWDEANRLRVVYNEVDETMQHYIYDASGERVLKASTDMENTYENGELVDPGSIHMNVYTTYASAFLVVDPHGVYSKHYYAGSQRIVSRLGDDNAGIFNEGQIIPPTGGEEPIDLPPTTQPGCEMCGKLAQLQKDDLQSIATKLKIGKVNFKTYSPATLTELEKAIAEEERMPTPPGVSLPPIYFYHPDHLGTSTALTDINGKAYQFFLNLPFGETMAEQKGSMYYNSPYKFNGKELDEETGLYYYGARYYDPRASIWLSVDPKFQDYPSWNPYNYTMQNPINLIDPTGMSSDDPGDYYGKDGKHMGSDGIADDKAYTADNVTKNDKGIVVEAVNKKDVGYKNSELLKLAAVSYAESDSKDNNKEEKFGIASACINNFELRNGKDTLSNVLSQISNATFDGNVRYEKFNNSSPENKNTDSSMLMSTAAALNAMSGGTDFSNGATGWDGKDLKTNGHRFGLNISDSSHDIFKVGDRPYKNPKVHNNSMYSRQSTSAYGNTMFYKIHPKFIKGGGRKW